MDKVFSARIDESVAARINALARQLNSTKKQVIEQAVERYAAQVEQEQQSGFLEQSFGAWNREEDSSGTVESARSAFRNSFERHRK